jgi:hypothetical protein
MVVAEPGQRRKLARILIANVVEYGLLMGVNEAARVSALEASATPTAADSQSILSARGGKRHGDRGERV